MKSSTLSGEIEIIKTHDFMESPTLALANALYHEGRLTEAVDLLSDHLERSTGDERLATAYLLAKTYNGARSLFEARQILHDHTKLADESNNHHLIARFRETLGGTFQLMGERENYELNADRALIEYAAASYHYERAGCPDVAGCTENNIGLIHGQLGKFDDAREHFNAARRLLQACSVKLAEVDMSEAQMCFAESGKEFEAYWLATKAMAVFTEHEEARLINQYTPTLRKALSDYEAAARGV